MFAYIYRFFRTRPRLLLGVLAGLIAYFGLPLLAHLLHFLPIAKTYSQMQPISQFLLAWVIGVMTYLVSIYHMMYRADEERILNRALAEDEGTILVVLLVIAASVVSVVAIIQELAASQNTEGWLMGFHLGLTFCTIVSAWLFMHTLFALHYASAYYIVVHKQQRHMLDFPSDTTPDEADNPADGKPSDDTPKLANNPTNDAVNDAANATSNPRATKQADAVTQDDRDDLNDSDDELPNYWDFLYFAFIIGTSGQTADVAFNTRQARQLGTLHCVLAFFFNVSIMALMINIASGLIGPK